MSVRVSRPTSSRLELAAVVELDRDLVGALDHVVVGDDVAVRRDDEARAQRVRPLLPARLAVLALHEVAEEVLERRAGGQDRAHAVGDLGDGRGGGDVDHRRAQPVGELGEALRHEARSGIDRERLRRRGRASAPRAGGSQREAEREQRRLQRSAGPACARLGPRANAAPPWAPARRPAPAVNLGSARPARKSRLRAPARSEDFTPATAQTRAMPRVTASRPTRRRRSGSMRAIASSASRIRAGASASASPSMIATSPRPSSSVVSHSGPRPALARRRRRRRRARPAPAPPARLRRVQVVEEGAVGLDHQRGVVGRQRAAVGVHRAHEGEELRIGAVGLGQDAVALGVALAADDVRRRARPPRRSRWRCGRPARAAAAPPRCRVRARRPPRARARPSSDRRSPRGSAPAGRRASAARR